MCRYTTAHSQNILHGCLFDGGFLVLNATQQYLSFIGRGNQRKPSLQVPYKS
jgi:hypothetical protein